MSRDKGPTLWIKRVSRIEQTLRAFGLDVSVEDRLYSGTGLRQLSVVLNGDDVWIAIYKGDNDDDVAKTYRTLWMWITDPAEIRRYIVKKTSA